MSRPVGGYALIGDCRSAALVSEEGSVDWLCWPRFDSPSVFGRLLDEAGGHWSVAPVGAFERRRRYDGETPVLVTELSSGNTRLTLTDFMSVASEREKRSLSLPEHEIVRILRCEAGEAEIESVFAPRPMYGRAFPVKKRGPVICCEYPQGLITLVSDIPFSVSDTGARAKIRVKAGGTFTCSLAFNAQSPAVIPPVGPASQASFSRSLSWWKGWAARTDYDGPYRREVMRSAVTLKLMGYAPSGTFVAAPTTSLPEREGGDLNWDYRYCWLRDSSLTIRALISLGYLDESRAYVSWLLHSTRLTLPRLNVLYDVYGRRPGEERTLPFSGYAGSRPVRTGNAAMGQLQLDVYGEVVDAAYAILKDEKRLDRETRELLILFARFVCGHWRDSESGIWEMRGEGKRYTYSLALCWTCLDRLLSLHAKGTLPGLPAGEAGRVKEEIRREIDGMCWNSRLGSFTASPGGTDVDASLLLLPYYGFIEASAPRMRSTYETVARMLSAGPGLFYRNRSFSEGAFGVCSCWAADFLARGGGSISEAKELFGRFLGYANDVGLFGEEVDPGTGRVLGNFPLAFTHLGVINAAMTIYHREQARS
ncbi:MAG: glycoside hydrolase family 15 protein [Deltaproteobacteria bacterium]